MMSETREGWVDPVNIWKRQMLGHFVRIREVLPMDDLEIMQDIRVEVNGKLRGRYDNIEVMTMHMASLIEELDAVNEQLAKLREAASKAESWLNAAIRDGSIPDENDNNLALGVAVVLSNALTESEGDDE
jgi:hypothetical protein